jgi:putative ABC transport system permease protein
MLRAHLRVAIRRLRDDLGYAAVNGIGLTIGLAVSMLIAFFVHHELSYDDFHPDADRLYRVSMTESFRGNQVPVRAPLPLGPAVENQFSGIEASVRVRASSHPVFVSTPNASPAASGRDGRRVRETNFSFADPALLDVLGFSLRRGNPETALQRPFSVVLSPEAAEKHFGASDPVGETLVVDGRRRYTVTGVLAEAPGPSHLSFDLLASYSTLPDVGVDTEAWALGGTSLYVKAAPDRGAPYVRDQVTKVVREKVDAGDLTVTPEPITSVHLHGQRAGGHPIAGNVQYLWLLGAIAALVLIMACVNYANLATARSLRKRTEIGLHKTMGAPRRDLIGRYLAESVAMSLAALVGASALAAVLLPWFGDVLGVDLRLEDGALVVGSLFVGVTLLTGVFAGAYPALYVSGLRPAEVLRGNASSGGGRGPFRTGLVVFQFATSIALLAGAFVIHDQLAYVQDRDLGFDDDRLLVVDLPSEAQDRYDALKQRLRGRAGVQSVTIAPMPGHEFVPNVSVRPQGGGRGEGDDIVWTPTFGVDTDFVSTMQVDVKRGRGFREGDRPGSGGAVLVNEAAVDKFGWDDGVGKYVEIPVGGDFVRRQVVGVVGDFHYGSLEESIDPVVIHLTETPGDFANLLVRVAPGDWETTLAGVQQAWADVARAAPFVYRFMDAEFASYYRAERRIGTLVGVAAGLAVLIAALGLFGLAAYVVERRTKEIGIRKALGATATNIFTLLVKDVLKLVVVAGGIATPFAYTQLDRWLSQFAYRVPLGADVFLLAASLAAALAVCAVSYQVLTTARITPVGHLRDG